MKFYKLFTALFIALLPTGTSAMNASSNTAF